MLRLSQYPQYRRSIFYSGSLFYEGGRSLLKVTVARGICYEALIGGGSENY